LFFIVAQKKMQRLFPILLGFVGIIFCLAKLLSVLKLKERTSYHILIGGYCVSCLVLSVNQIIQSILPDESVILATISMLLMALQCEAAAMISVRSYLRVICQIKLSNRSVLFLFPCSCVLLAAPIFYLRQYLLGPLFLLSVLTMTFCYVRVYSVAHQSSITLRLMTFSPQSMSDQVSKRAILFIFILVLGHGLILRFEEIDGSDNLFIILLLVHSILVPLSYRETRVSVAVMPVPVPQRSRRRTFLFDPKLIQSIQIRSPPEQKEQQPFSPTPQSTSPNKVPLYF